MARTEDTKRNDVEINLFPWSGGMISILLLLHCSLLPIVHILVAHNFPLDWPIHRILLPQRCACLKVQIGGRWRRLRTWQRTEHDLKSASSWLLLLPVSPDRSETAVWDRGPIRYPLPHKTAPRVGYRLSRIGVCFRGGEYGTLSAMLLATFFVLLQGPSSVEVL